MHTCVNCERSVLPTKVFSVGWFFFWLLIGAGVGAVAYLIYFLVKQTRDCPLCREDVYVLKRQRDPDDPPWYLR